MEGQSSTGDWRVVGWISRHWVGSPMCNSACCVFKLSHTLVTIHWCVCGWAWKNNRIREEVPLRTEYVARQFGLKFDFSDPSRTEKLLRFHNTVNS